MNSPVNTTCLCGGRDLDEAFVYRRPPAGEVRFDFGQDKTYFRRMLRCKACGHYLSVHDIDMTKLYEGNYVNSTYGEDGLSRAFERIIGLDPSKSDNVARVKRIIEFASRYFPDHSKGRHSVLDVGSGLCVFLYRLKAETGWDCTALDPDPRNAVHAQERVGIKAVCGDFMHLDNLGRYDLITFNKVLEHVLDPVRMLARSVHNLNSDGFVYVELPDGEAAGADNQDREEFFIDHHHVFSMESMRILATRAGFQVVEIERLREPSTKYTLRAFLEPWVKQTILS